MSDHHLLVSKRVMLPGSEGMRMVHACIETQGSRIANVFELGSDFAVDLASLASVRGVPVHDFGEKPITPAFVNAHTHLAMSFFRAWDAAASVREENLVEDFFYALESRLTPEDVRAFARVGAFECLLTGTALVWDHYYHGEALAQALEDTGLCGVVAPTLQDVAGPGVPWCEAGVEATLAIHRSDTQAARGIFAAWGPHATDTVSEDLWHRIARLAEETGLPLHAHLAQSSEEYLRARERAGVSPVGFLERQGVLELNVEKLFVHVIYADETDLSVLASSRHTTLGYCPFSQLIFHFPAPVRAWDALGCPFIVATDCVASNDSMNVQKELRYLAGQPGQGLAESREFADFLEGGGEDAVRKLHVLRGRARVRAQRFSNPEFLMRTVWQTPGALHPGFQVGTLAPGALANLIVWDSQHPAFWPGQDILRTLAFGDTTGAIHNLMSAGRWQGESGRYAESLRASAPVRDAIREADERLAALKARL